MFGWLRSAERRAAAATAPAAAAHNSAVESNRMLERIEWTVVRRLDGVLQGDYRTLFRGMGLDLADLREYQSHDDVRHIDWNVTARTQIAHVREFHEPREVTAWFIIDLSASLDFGSAGVAKRTLAVELVATLARLFVRHGNRVGALIHGPSGDEVVMPKGGRQQVVHILDRAQRCALPSKHAPAETTRLSSLLAHAQGVIKRRSVVFVVSDFLSADPWGRALDPLARRHEVLAFRIADPLEFALPNLGAVVMQDSETGQQLFVDTGDARFRKRFAAAAAKRADALREQLARAGVDGIEFMTDEPLDTALMRYVHARKRRSIAGHA
ncbi:DUF58 domain-containing protein [soil metagenome]